MKKQDLELHLKRAYCGERYTIGHITIEDDPFKCDSIERPVRDKNRNGKFDNGEKKIKGDTAIPFGRYEITMRVISPTYSKKNAFAFTGGCMPRLLNVPEFEGILIHTGNTEKDSLGCIVVGLNKVKGQVVDSMVTFRRLYAILQEAHKAGRKIYITIE